MASFDFIDDEYRTKPQPIPWRARTFPSITFHWRFLKMIVRASSLARRGLYDDRRWIDDSLKVIRELEGVGVEFEITGVSQFANLGQPCLFIGNHMSALETIVLPAIIQPQEERGITFVVKSTLLKYPVFKHIIRTRHPIVVSRTNPREDLRIILREGVDRLHRGISIVIFPQSTRMRSFDPAQFNKIGVKLAARAGVPIVPLALQTDAWRQGIFRIDFGKIDTARRVRFAFGAPIAVQGHGHAEHQAICEFIGSQIQAWNANSG